MFLRKLKVSNFRALENIDVEFKKNVTVIVGPNAAGKTTILESVRLLKALLAPRTQNEIGQVILSLGAASPHLPNQMRLHAIARDINIPVMVEAHFRFSADEISILEQALDNIAQTAVQAQIGQQFAAPGALISYISSPQGQLHFTTTKEKIQTELNEVRKVGGCHLQIKLTQARGIESMGNPEQVQLFAYLERRLPPHLTGFTYFPADRALPTGEVNVQLGGPDTSLQLESYNSQPQTKFNRLKNTIFSAKIIGDAANKTESIDDQFAAIFDGILKGRKLREFGVNEIGLLSVLIQDAESGHTFDLDGMSSGEKGIILTFLLIARSVIDGGVVLLDEPELHLNPAVCKDLLQHLIATHVVPRNLQILICSHSPEILTTALEQETTCSVFQLESKDSLTEVRPQDETILTSALQRLGANASESLLYRGVVFLEGPEDIAIVEAGFAHLFRRFKLKQATGRNEIIKAVVEIQAAEKEGNKPPITYFVFDRDESPTGLSSSPSARVLEWDRRCIENYLIDDTILEKYFLDPTFVKQPPSSYKEMQRLIKQTAFQQIEPLAAKIVYKRKVFVGLGFRREDVADHPTISEIADRLSDRILSAKQQLENFDVDTWKLDYLREVAEEKKRIEAQWEFKWTTDCNGKRLFLDLQARLGLKMSLKKFKIEVIKEMAVNRTQGWLAVEQAFNDLLSTKPGA